MAPSAVLFRNAGPLAKTVAALTITTIVVLTNKLVYAPYMHRERLRRAEDWANVILEQEEQNENEGSNNNISYRMNESYL